MKKYIVVLGLGVIVSGIMLVNHTADGDDAVQLTMSSPQEVAQMFEIRSKGNPENYEKAAREIVAFYESKTPTLTEDEKRPWKDALCSVLQSKGTVAQGLVPELHCSASSDVLP